LIYLLLKIKYKVFLNFIDYKSNIILLDELTKNNNYFLTCLTIAVNLNINYWHILKTQQINRYNGFKSLNIALKTLGIICTCLSKPCKKDKNRFRRIKATGRLAIKIIKR